MSILLSGSTGSTSPYLMFFGEGGRRREQSKTRAHKRKKRKQTSLHQQQQEKEDKLRMHCRSPDINPRVRSHTIQSHRDPRLEP